MKKDIYSNIKDSDALESFFSNAELLVVSIVKEWIALHLVM